MVIVEDSYIQIKYAKNFEWLNPHDNPGGEGGAGSGGAPPPPNQNTYSNDPPEAVKKHLKQLGISPDTYNSPKGFGNHNSGALAEFTSRNSNANNS